MNVDLSEITKFKKDDSAIPNFSSEEIVDALNSNEWNKQEKDALLEYLLLKSQKIFFVHILGEKILPNISNRIVDLIISLYEKKYGTGSQVVQKKDDSILITEIRKRSGYLSQKIKWKTLRIIKIEEIKSYRITRHDDSTVLEVTI